MTTASPNWFGFLSDEERVPHSVLSALSHAGALLDRAASKPETVPETVFVSANLVSLVLFRLGRLDDARALCAAEIGYAYHHPDPALRPRLAALGLQPQLNLLRIEGYAGDLDTALAGLAALEEIADGHPVDTPQVRCSPDDFAGDPQLGRRIRALARNVRVSDTCKILLRRGRTGQLLTEAARLRGRWPDLAAQGLQHAAEAPWAACPEQQTPPGPGELYEGDTQSRRLAYVRTLHLAAYEAGCGRAARARELAWPLDAPQAATEEGGWASELTVPRWQAVLGAVLLATGDATRGRELLLDALEFGDRLGDTALSGGVRRLLGLPAPVPPDKGEVAARITELTQRLTDRLTLAHDEPVSRPAAHAEA